MIYLLQRNYAQRRSKVGKTNFYTPHTPSPNRKTVIAPRPTVAQTDGLGAIALDSPRGHHKPSRLLWSLSSSVLCRVL